jgi:hypothetical protein
MSRTKQVSRKNKGDGRKAPRACSVLKATRQAAQLQHKQQLKRLIESISAVPRAKGMSLKKAAKRLCFDNVDKLNNDYVDDDGK